MGKIYISPKSTWTPVDIQYKTKPFALNAAGTEVHPNAIASTVLQIAEALNHLSAYTCKLLCSHVTQKNFAVARVAPYSNYSAPFLTYRVYDCGPIHDVMHGFVYRPLADDPSYGCNISYSDTISANNATRLATSDIAPNKNRIVYDMLQEPNTSYTLGTITKGLYYDTAATDDTITFHDVRIQEVPRVGMDVAGGSYNNLVAPYVCKPGRRITNTIIEDIRSSLHELRSLNMPLIISWCAEAVDEAAANDAFTTSSATFVNILDTAHTSRSLTSPGIMADAFGAGVGTATTVNCRVWIYAEVSGGTGVVRFLGPNHVADSPLDVNITATSATWVNGGTFTLNTDREYDFVATTDLNKIDIHAHADTSQSITIRAICGWLEY